MSRARSKLASRRTSQLEQELRILLVHLQRMLVLQLIHLQRMLVLQLNMRSVKHQKQHLDPFVFGALDRFRVYRRSHEHFLRPSCILD